MEPQKWKRALLNWVNECGFVEQNHLIIEQTDIELFFQKFSEQLKKKKNNDITMDKTDLASFFKNNYPDFDLRFDDKNVLNAADYIYVYSLLMHYSCVKSPKEIFHEICQRLPEKSQQVIANFFKELLDNPNVTRDILCLAISNAVQNSPSTQSSASPSSAYSDSPVRLYRNATRISPTTPKTPLLEERTRDLYNLKALLETERYEKGLLEIEIKQNEETITKLNKDYKKLQQKIHELKKEFYTEDRPCSSSNHNDEDQVKKRMYKEINLKNQEITKITEVLNQLKEERQLFQEKLCYTEKRLTIFMPRIRDLEYNIDELHDELQQKDAIIQNLRENQNELEHFIKEIRSIPKNGRGDINTSVDCLDSSLSRNTGSSSDDPNSPEENLGSSVVDVQLREKEIENNQLKQQISSERAKNDLLAKQIRDSINKYSIDLDISVEMPTTVNVHDDEGDNIDPMMDFQVLVKGIEKICTTIQCLKNSNEELVNQMEQRKSELDSLHDIIFEELKRLNDGINDFDFIDRHEARYEDEMKNIQMAMNVLVKQNEKLGQDRVRHENFVARSELKEQELNELLQQKDEELKKNVVTIEEMNEKLTLANATILDLQTNLQEEIALKTADIKQLQDEYDDIVKQKSSIEVALTSNLKEIDALHTRSNELLTSRDKLQEDNEAVFQLLTDEVKRRESSDGVACQLKIQLEQLEIDNEVNKNRLQSLLVERNTYMEEMEELRGANDKLKKDLQNGQSELERAQENMAYLTDRIEALQSENNILVHEQRVAREDLNNAKTNMQNAIDKAEKFESACASIESELRTYVDMITSKDLEIDRSTSEIKKLHDTHDTLNKRIEKMALKLGELQADRVKLERETEKLLKIVDGNKVLLDTIQRERDNLQKDNRTIKEKTARLERSLEQYRVKLERVEKAKTLLEEEIESLTAIKEENKAMLMQFEKINQVNEDELRKKNDVIKDKEEEIARLNLMIGDLDGQLQAVKDACNAEKSEAMQCHQRELAGLNERLVLIEKLNDQLEEQATKLRTENTNLDAELLKVSEALKSNKKQNDFLTNELKQTQASLEMLREEKEYLNKCYQDAMTSSHALLEEKEAIMAKRTESVSSLKMQLQAKCAQIKEMQGLVAKVPEREAEIRKVQERFTTVEQEMEKCQRLLTQLHLDNDVLTAKYQNAKQNIMEERQACEDRIKENRLEMEGKLEKMKSKMDASHVLDDSMSALLSTTAATRKKVTGATSYKRPGPPTPSKNAGRLSLGGNSEPMREILKETHDENPTTSLSSMSTRTPARFKVFRSRFSMGNAKDESTNKTSTCSTSKVTAAGVVCTSTPRKSKLHYDMKHLLNEICMKESPLSSRHITGDDAPPSNAKMNAGQSSTKVSKKITPATTTTTASSTRSSLVGIQRNKRYRRSSVYYCGRVRAPPRRTVGHRNSTMKKVRKNLRLDRFNRFRHMISAKEELLRSDDTPSDGSDDEKQKVHTKDGEARRSSLNRQIDHNAVVDVKPFASGPNIEDNDNHHVDKDDLLPDVDGRIKLPMDDEVASSGHMVESNKKMFEQILNETQSNAPFEISEIQFDAAAQTIVKPTSGSSLTASGFHGSNTVSSSQMSSLSSGHLSRTIYGGSIIYNRKIPNVNTTLVRKSSIYVRNNVHDPTDSNANIILVTDQTITIADLLSMWSQMDNVTRAIVTFAAATTMATVGYTITLLFGSH